MDYEPETGVFRWKVARRGPHARVGDEVGTVNSEGYRVIKIDWRLYKASRLAHLYMTGAWPQAEIDHVNLDKTDNRWSNLRGATRSQNHPTHKNNRSRLKGVRLDNRWSPRWRAVITVNRGTIYLGSFDCPAGAHFAYIIAAKKYHGAFARAS